MIHSTTATDPLQPFDSILVNADSGARMSAYRLDKLDSKRYLDQFDESKLELLPYRAEGLYRQSNGEWERVDKDSGYSDAYFFGERPSQWTCELRAKDFTFGVGFPDNDNRHSKSWYLEKIRSVLSQVGELDAAARSQGGTAMTGENYEEYLGSFYLDGTELQFCYFSSAVNTSWEVYFNLDSLGNWSLGGES